MVRMSTEGQTDTVWMRPEEEGGPMSEEQRDAEGEEQGDLWVFVEVMMWR